MVQFNDIYLKGKRVLPFCNYKLLTLLGNKDSCGRTKRQVFKPKKAKLHCNYYLKLKTGHTNIPSRARVLNLRAACSPGGLFMQFYHLKNVLTPENIKIKSFTM